MHAMLPYLLPSDFPPLRRNKINTLQVNLGYLCNQRCLHCHVNAGPNRTEIMSKHTVKQVLAALDRTGVKTLDLTGGAPELNPHFRYLVKNARAMGIHVIDRCNLTVLEQPGLESMAAFLAEHQIEIVSSLPCYLQENVDGQRGKGVYQSSMRALQRLNNLGYGQDNGALILNLVYNPTGPFLPPAQDQLEADYKRELLHRYGIRFNHLLALANLPIQRFGSMLVSKNQFNDYMALLKSSHQDDNLNAVMCRSLVSVDWRGILYDCDFNQMLDMPISLLDGKAARLDDLGRLDLETYPVCTADHCYGCTAGQGSSCGGALS